MPNKTMYGRVEPHNCLIYFYAIIIYSSDIDQHPERQDELFKRLLDFSLTIQLIKMDLVPDRNKLPWSRCFQGDIKTGPIKTET